MGLAHSDKGFLLEIIKLLNCMNFLSQIRIMDKFFIIN